VATRVESHLRSSRGDDLPIGGAHSAWGLHEFSVQVERRACAQYRVKLLDEPLPTAEGIEYSGEGGRSVLPWPQIELALTAEVGEPEGVRTIVFDFIVAREGGRCQVRRMDADPGEDAMELARVLGDNLGPDCTTASIKSVATDGIASRWYPDIESFELDSLHSLNLMD